MQPAFFFWVVEKKLGGGGPKWWWWGAGAGGRVDVVSDVPKMNAGARVDDIASDGCDTQDTSLPS
jgi:hypothetical protein